MVSLRAGSNLDQIWGTKDGYAFALVSNNPSLEGALRDLHLFNLNRPSTEIKVASGVSVKARAEKLAGEQIFILINQVESIKIFEYKWKGDNDVALTLLQEIENTP